MKKKFLFALAASASTIACALALMPKNGIMSFAEGCEHEGNHYLAKEASCTKAGNVEFWACCLCHEQFITTPGKGTWVDQGVYNGPSLDSTHPAYVAPNSNHTPGSWAVYERDTTLGVNASCSECGAEVYENDVTSVEKPVVSTAEWTVDTTVDSSYPWVYDEDTKTYTAGNKMVGNSLSYFQVNVTKTGTIVFDISIICEIGYDYFCVYKNSNITSWTSSVSYTSNGNVYNTYKKGANTGYVETVSLDVVEGDILMFTKRADGSGWGSKNGSSYDEAVVKFKTAYTYGLLTLDTQGGSSVYPGITVNGCVATDLPTPTKDGYTFDGWYKSVSYVAGEEVAEGTYVGDNVTIYAKWWDNNNVHSLAGSYKGFAFKSGSATSGSVPSLLNNYTLDINYKGQVVHSGTTDNLSGTISELDENGVATLKERNVKYYEEDGVIVISKPSESFVSSDYFWIFVKDSEQTYTSSTVLGTGFGGYSVGTYVVFNFPLADGTLRTFYANGVDGVGSYIYRPQIVSVIPDVAIKNLTNSSYNVGFSVSDGVTTLKYGYDGSSFVPVTDSYFGAYTNTVADDEVTTLYVSGAGRYKTLKNDSLTSVSTYYVQDAENNILYYASGADAETYTLDLENNTFTRSVPTVTVTYDLNGHEATLVAASSAKFAIEGNTQKFCKALTSSSGAWLYSDEYAKIQDGYSTDGLYSFEGWYTDAACTDAVGNTHATEDFTLYAKWARAYLVTIVNNNGGENSTVKVNEGTTPTLTTPTKEGYMFAGWYTDEELTTPYVPGAIGEDITVYAKWAEKPEFAKGIYYAGFNLYGTNYNKTNSAASGYKITFNDDGTITKGTSKISGVTYSPDTTLVNGVATFGTSKLGYFAKTSTNRFVQTQAYGGYSSDPVPGDMNFGVQLFNDESASFVQTTLIANKAYLCQVTVALADASTETFVSYIDCENDAVYADVTLETVTAGVSSNAFSSVYASSKFADTITIKQGDAVVGVFGKSGSSVVRGDAYAGTYTGTFNGVEQAVVFDGFGNVTIGDGSLTGKYVVDGTEATLTINSKTYVITLSGTTYTQVLDGLEGTYTGEQGELIITGWGECTLAGVSGTYSISSETTIKVVVNDATSFVTLDKSSNTYVAASASIFAGLEFVGNHKDNHGDTEKFYLIFDDSPAITGIAQFGSSSFKATFTGTYSDGVLVITYTSDIYGNVLTGKTTTFAVSNQTLTCTADELTGIYTVQTGVNLYCDSFTLPGTSEGTGGSESESTLTLQTGTYIGEVSTADYSLVITSTDLGSLAATALGTTTTEYIAITDNGDGTYDFISEESSFSGTITVVSDTKLSIDLYDVPNSVYETVTFTKA